MRIPLYLFLLEKILARKDVHRYMLLDNRVIQFTNAWIPVMAFPRINVWMSLKIG